MPMSESSLLKTKENDNETEIKEVGSSSYCCYQILLVSLPLYRSRFGVADDFGLYLCLASLINSHGIGLVL